MLLLATTTTAGFHPTALAGRTLGSFPAPTLRMALDAAPPAGFAWQSDDVPQEADDAVAAVASPTAAVDAEKVFVLSNAAEVAAAVNLRVEDAAQAAIAARGHFALAIPGGSVLNMLAGTAPEWASKCTIVYVNHKAVPMDDAALATHAKASAKFLDAGWAGCDVIVMDGTDDAQAEAASYESKLKALGDTRLPRDPTTGLPIFDLMLIGVGDDGHVGSLYPAREEVLDTSGRWVLPVEMKQPGSITLSLPVMQASKEVVIAACGVSEKYPKGKSEAMGRGVEGDETPSTFPAVGLRPYADWYLDNAAAQTLSVDYAECFSLDMSRGDCNPDGVDVW